MFPSSVVLNVMRVLVPALAGIFALAAFLGGKDDWTGLGSLLVAALLVGTVRLVRSSAVHYLVGGAFLALIGYGFVVICLANTTQLTWDVLKDPQVPQALIGVMTGNLSAAVVAEGMWKSNRLPWFTTAESHN